MSAKCPNCGKTVYFAEEVRCIGLSWHKRCLKCAQCNIALDSAAANDRQGKVYCKSCYNSVSGLKGFGHGTSSESSVSGGAAGNVRYANAPIDEQSALGSGFSDGYQVSPATTTANRAPHPVSEVKTEPSLLPVPRIHQQQQQQAQEPQPSSNQPSFNPVVKPSVSTGTDGYALVNDGDWAYFDVNLAFKGAGHGAAELKKHLPNGECGFAFWRIVRANVGNAGAGVITEANIVLQYKGSQTSAIKKVKSNSNLDSATKKCPNPYKGFVEVLTNGNNLSDETIFDRWKPGSGSKVIDA